MKLRLANTNETKRFYFEELDDDGNVIEVVEDTWIELQDRMSKRQANNLLRFAPKEDGDIDAGLRFIEKACQDLIVGWSLEDEDGNMVAPSADVYGQLDAEAANWVDRTVSSHLREALGGKAEKAEKKEEN